MSMPPTKPTLPVLLAMAGHHAHQEAALVLLEDDGLHVGQVDHHVDDGELELRETPWPPSPRRRPARSRCRRWGWRRARPCGAGPARAAASLAISNSQVADRRSPSSSAPAPSKARLVEGHAVELGLVLDDVVHDGGSAAALKKLAARLRPRFPSGQSSSSSWRPLFRVSVDYG